MRGSSLLAIACVAGLLAGCLRPADPDPEEALSPEDTVVVDALELQREVRATTQGLDSSSPQSYLDLANARLDNLSARLDAHVANQSISPEDANATRAAIAEERDRLFWIGVTADARADPEGSFAAAENKTAQAEERLANATDFADVGKARSDLLHAQAILVAIQVYAPEAVPREALDALVQRVEADLVRIEGWGPA